MSLSDLGSKHGFSVHDDFVQFQDWIEQEGLIDRQAQAGAQRLNTTESIPAWPVAEQAQGRTDAHELYDEISDLYGRARIEEEISEGDEADGEMATWHQRLLRHGYPIGQTYSGDLIVQIAAGGHRGEIYFSNHESWHGFFEHFGSPDASEREELEEEVEDVMEELGLSSLGELTTDQFVAVAAHDSLDGMTFLASDLPSFYQQLRITRGG